MTNKRQGGPINVVCLVLLVVGLGLTVAGGWEVGLSAIGLGLILAVGNSIRVYRRKA